MNQSCGRWLFFLVDADSYPPKSAGYVALNPVRAGRVAAPGDWPWSRYRATVGREDAPACLEVDVLLAQFGNQRGGAVEGYLSLRGRGHRRRTDLAAAEPAGVSGR